MSAMTITNANLQDVIDDIARSVRRELDRIAEDIEAVPDCLPLDDLRTDCESMVSQGKALLHELGKVNERLRDRSRFDDPREAALTAYQRDPSLCGSK